MVSKTPHEWSTDSLLAKAQRYAMKMHEQSRENWEFGFWSALCMEMIVRAAVARSSPALLADGKDWTNIAHAIGVKSSAAKTLPKSIDITDAVGRAQALYPAYTRELGGYAQTAENFRCRLCTRTDNRSELPDRASLGIDGL